MAQSHTWNFYLTAGRRWGGPRISGASITAYSTSTGSTVLKALTTNASGYATYTLTGTAISPGSYYWRVNIGNIFGDYYNGANIIGAGDATGYYYTPGSALNTQGQAIISSSFVSMNVNATGTITLYLFVVGNNVTIPSSKFLTHFDVLALIPPIDSGLSSGTTIMKLNRCIEEYEMMGYQGEGAFDNSVQFGNGEGLVIRDSFQEFTGFISGSSVSPTLSTTSLSWTYSENGSTSVKSVTGTCSSNFTPSVSITGSSSSYFAYYMSSISSTAGTYKFSINIYPTNTNYTNSTRTATARVSLRVSDTNAWFGGTVNSVNIVLSQGYYQSGGSSGSTGGGGTGGGGTQT